MKPFDIHPRGCGAMVNHLGVYQASHRFKSQPNYPIVASFPKEFLKGEFTKQKTKIFIDRNEHTQLHLLLANVILPFTKENKIRCKELNQLKKCLGIEHTYQEMGTSTGMHLFLKLETGDWRQEILKNI